MKKTIYRNNRKPTEKLAGPHNERRLPSKNYNRGKNGREKEKTKTENDVTGLDDERGLQQVEGESWTSWLMAPLNVRTCLGRQRTKKKEVPSIDMQIAYWSLKSEDQTNEVSVICRNFKSLFGRSPDSLLLYI